jgi:DNA-binding MarR family transcriptional regulator
MISELDKTVAHNIRDMVTKLNRSLRKRVSNMEQLLITEQNVLQLLIHTEQLLPSELCMQLNISSQYMSQVLNKLSDLKLITRKESQKDKRKSFVLLSKKGKAQIEKSRHEREEWLASAFAEHFSDQEKEIIQKAVAMLLPIYDL